MKQQKHPLWIEKIRPVALSAALAFGLFSAPLIAGEEAPQGPPPGGPSEGGRRPHRPEGREGRSDRPGERGDERGPEMGLQAADADHDGTVTKQEFMAFHESLFGKLDANTDGKVDQEEIREQMEKRRGELRDRARDAMERHGRGPRGEDRPDGPPPGEAPRDEDRPDGASQPPAEPQFGSDGVTPRAPRPENRSAHPPEAMRPQSSLEISQMIMKELDVNGDGRLQKDEVPEQIAAAFDRLDTNKDGALGPEDGGILRKLQDREHAAGQRGKMLIERHDKNGNGKLEKDELPEKIAERLGNLDKNGDGTLDPDELAGGDGPSKPRKAGKGDKAKPKNEEPSPGETK